MSTPDIPPLPADWYSLAVLVPFFGAMYLSANITLARGWLVWLLSFLACSGYLLFAYGNLPMALGYTVGFSIWGLFGRFMFRMIGRFSRRQLRKPKVFGVFCLILMLASWQAVPASRPIIEPFFTVVMVLAILYYAFRFMTRGGRRGAR